MTRAIASTRASSLDVNIGRIGGIEGENTEIDVDAGVLKLSEEVVGW